MAVSYTHLDVYKRQHPNLPQVTLPEEIRLTDDLAEAVKDKDLLVLSCLLYTSRCV